jgi:XTP/dITP diphosphohydrolase
MSDLYFLSSNVDKYEEIRMALERHDIRVRFSKRILQELQSDSLDYIALQKCKIAFKLISKPVLVEDDGLFIHGLGGFPGPYSSYIFKTIGNTGILKLLSGSNERSAWFTSVLAYTDGKITRRFVGEVIGTISLKANGKGWGYDPIFVPSGQDKTFGILGEEKTLISHRAHALTSFAVWYNRYKSRR